MSATGDNIGLMEGAFFVGRKIILDWINDFLQLNLGRIEETCTGAIACQLCDALYPGKVNMSKVRWDARADFEYVANYKIIQDCFGKVGVAKKVPVQLLIRGKYQDNLEFMQWFKRFFELNHNGDAYDAVSRRRRGKGGTKFIGKGAPKKKVTSREKRDKFNSAAGSAARTRTSRAAPGSSTDSGGKRSEEKENQRTTTNHRTSRAAKAASSRTRGGRPAAAGPASSAEINGLRRQVGSLTDDKEALQKRNAEQQLTIDGLEKERDFYFGKLRDIEILLQSVEEDHGTFNAEPEGAEATLKDLVERGLKILYATEGEDFVAVQDLAEEEQEPEETVEEEEQQVQRGQEPVPPLAEVDSVEVAVPAPEQKEIEGVDDDEETF